MKILITGGAGYIGTELTYKLSENPDVSEIIVYDNLSRPNYNLFIGRQKFIRNKVKFIEGDILDSRKLRQVLKDVDVVYHLAAKVTTPFADQNPHLFEQVNHWGTAELLYAIEESDVSKLIYTSSVSLYGASNKEVDVNSPLNPRTFYGISKMRGEDHVSRLFSKMPAYSVRCGNVYGYNKSMRFDAVINRFMFDANFTGRIKINGDGTQQRAFIHIEKVASALSNLLNSDLKSGKYDLVDKNISINELADALLEVFVGLERLYVNQHMSLRNLTVKVDTRLAKLIEAPEKSLFEELKEFKTMLTFTS
ncbi:MAG: ADP-glyceromanno-heptose 6-epimerase [Flavobacteriales bacterium]|nr:MAG: ADP-glyceromanno-heptose 6-epimerase [Flavobacteriales bacterium]